MLLLHDDGIGAEWLKMGDGLWRCCCRRQCGCCWSNTPPDAKGHHHEGVTATAVEACDERECKWEWESEGGI